MTPAKFVEEWGAEISAAIQDVAESLREAGYSTGEPSPLVGADDESIWTMPIWKGTSEVVNAIWGFYPVYDEEPLKYWPALDVITYGGRELGSSSFWDKLVNLEDDQEIRQVIRWMPYSLPFILQTLEGYRWPLRARGGARGWKL